MKIAMIGQFPPHIGGVGTHIHNLSKELIKNGEKVYVINYPHKKIENKPNTNYMGLDGIKIIGTKGINIKGLRSLFYIIFGTTQLIHLNLKENIDIIHGHYLFPAGFIAALVGIFTKKRIYLTAHGSDIYHLYTQYKFIRPIIHFVLKQADLILTVSEDLKKEILKMGIKGIENKIQLTWNTVDINKFSPLDNEDTSDIIDLHSFKTEFNIPENKQIVLFIGNINKRKNVSTLLNAKKHIKSDCVLVVVGNGPLLKSLKEKVKSEKIKNVVFTGARKDISRIIRNSDIFVLPSYKEGSGIVLLEALACGKPVIGSKIGGTKELITSDVGLLFEPTDSKQLANAIDSILINADLKKKFQKNARKLAMDYAEVDISYYQ